MTEKEFDAAMAPILGTWPHRWQGPRITLVKDAVLDLDYWDFKQICENFVRTKADSPLPEDIIQEAKRLRSSKVKADTRKAADVLAGSRSVESLKRVLVQNYPGCKTFWDAVQLTKKKSREGKGE